MIKMLKPIYSTTSTNASLGNEVLPVNLLVLSADTLSNIGSIMGNYLASISWHRHEEESFTDQKYSRAHQWDFDGGINIKASSSPQVVKLPWSVEDAVDPEEAFVAALSSCHMLWFLSIAAKDGFRVDDYLDRASGYMGKNAQGRLAM